MEPVWTTQDFIRDVYLSICRDSEELPSREGLDWITKLFRSNKGNGIIMRSARIGPAAAITLAKRLESNSLAFIDLYDNMLRDTGFMAMLKFSERHPTFKWLCVGCNSIGTEGCMALAEILQGNTSLEAVELGKPTGYIFSKLRKQDFSSSGTLHNNYIDSSSAARIAKALMYNSTLKYLGLGGNFVGVLGANGSGQLKSMSSRYSGISLDADGPTSIGAMLAINTSLTALDLSNNKLGNAGITAVLRGLGRNKSLLRLDLSRNHMTFITTPMIACIISNPRCVLEELYLSGNPLGLDGAKALAHGLSCARSLTTLAIENCTLGDDGVAIICAVLSDPLVENNGKNDHLSNMIKKVVSSGHSNNNEGVEEPQLAYDRMQEYFDMIIESKQNAPNKLIIIRDSMGKIIRKAPIPSKNTKEQSIKPTKEPAESIRFTAELKDTESIIDEMANKTIEVIAKSKMTSGPELDEYQLSSSEFERATALKVPDSATFQYATQLRSECNESRDMEELYSEMEQTDINIGVDSSYMPREGSSNAQYSQITSLNISSNGIREQGIHYLCRLVSTRPHFRYLNISYNRLDNDGAIRLASALLCDQINMEEVISYYTDYERAKLDRSKPILSDPERVNKDLRSLDLTTCHISDVGFIALCFACLNLPNLVHLNLKDNFVGARSGEIGLQIMEENKVITSMIMRGNQISHTSALKLLRILKRNRRSIAMSVPLMLKQQIAEREIETKQLNILQEELDFMSQTVVEAESHNRSIQDLMEEMIEAFIRQKASLEQKIRQTEDASQLAVESAAAQTERMPLVAVQIQQQIANAQANLGEEVMNVAKAEEDYQDIMKRMTEAENTYQAEITRIDTKIDDLQQKIKQAEEVNKKAEKLIDSLRNSYNHVINRAYQSRYLNRTTGAMNPDIMAQVIERMAPVATGTYTITRPIGYDVTESLLTPPETPPRPTKSTKGKKSAKGKKGKTASGAARPQTSTSSRPATSRKLTTPPQTTMPGKRRL